MIEKLKESGIDLKESIKNIQIPKENDEKGTSDLYEGIKNNEILT